MKRLLATALAAAAMYMADATNMLRENTPSYKVESVREATRTADIKGTELGHIIMESRELPEGLVGIAIESKYESPKDGSGLKTIVESVYIK